MIFLGWARGQGCLPWFFCSEKKDSADFLRRVSVYIPLLVVRISIAHLGIMKLTRFYSGIGLFHGICVCVNCVNVCCCVCHLFGHLKYNHELHRDASCIVAYSCISSRWSLEWIIWNWTLPKLGLVECYFLLPLETIMNWITWNTLWETNTAPENWCFLKRSFPFGICHVSRC